MRDDDDDDDDNGAQKKTDRLRNIATYLELRSHFVNLENVYFCLDLVSPVFGTPFLNSLHSF